MHSRRILRGRTLSLALGTSLVLGGCADAPPTAPRFAEPARGPDLVIGTALGQVTEQTIAAGYNYSLALRPDGTATSWGGIMPQTPYMTFGPGGEAVPPGLSGVVAVAARWEHSLALLSNGTMVEWGRSVYWQVPAINDAVAVSTGWFHSLALRSDGTVVAWGQNWNGQTSVPAGLSGVVAIAGGERHSLALRSDGTVVAWGSNAYGQASVPAGLDDVVEIAAGWGHSVALRSDGTVVAWGSQVRPVPPELSGVVAIAAGSNETLALKSDGTVVRWGPWADVPPGLSDVVAISAGAGHLLALRRDGTIVAWGNNTYGQTSVPAGTIARVPNAAPSAAGITPPAGIVSGHRYTFAVAATDRDGDALTYAWDMNADGIPEQTSALAGIYHALPAGGTHTVRVTITDTRGAQVHRTAVVAVEQNVAPVAVIAPVPAADEGTVFYPRAVVTDANSATDPNELRYMTYLWDFGDGTTSTSATPSRRYTNSGTFRVQLTVTDRGGASHTTETQVQVNNAPPRATLVAPPGTIMPALDVYDLTARSITDPGPGDRASLEIAFDCGDGYRAYTRDLAAAVECVAPPGRSRRTVGLRVRDRDGAVTEYRRNYTIR